jgi:hypothetical protein
VHDLDGDDPTKRAANVATVREFLQTYKKKMSVAKTESRNAFAAEFDPHVSIVTCASCGMSDEKGTDACSGKPTHFMNIPLSDCDVFAFSSRLPQDISKKNKILLAQQTSDPVSCISHDKMFSYCRIAMSNEGGCRDTTGEDIFFHLIPEFVNSIKRTTDLCARCHSGMLKYNRYIEKKQEQDLNGELRWNP